MDDSYGVNYKYLNIENCSKSNLKIIVVSGLFITWALTSFVFASNTIPLNNSFATNNDLPDYVQKGEVVEVGSGTMVLMSKLKNLGFDPNVVSPINREFFSVEGRIITLDKSNIKVFEYEEGVTLTEDVMLFRDSANTSYGSWKKDVNIYTNENLIIFYMGESKSILESLESIFGSSMVL